MLVAVSKLEAARRQLKTGIEILFSRGDEVAAHTLVGAASRIVSDLVEAKCPERSWDRYAQEANDLSTSDYFAIMRRSQNFLKHAERDPDSTKEFDPSDTDALAFWTVMNLGELECELSIQESVLQLWYLASYSPSLDHQNEQNRLALELFGDLRSLERIERISAGARVMSEQVKLSEGKQ